MIKLTLERGQLHRHISPVWESYWLTSQGSSPFVSCQYLQPSIQQKCSLECSQVVKENKLTGIFYTATFDTASTELFLPPSCLAAAYILVLSVFMIVTGCCRVPRTLKLMSLLTSLAYCFISAIASLRWALAAVLSTPAFPVRLALKLIRFVLFGGA